MEPVSIDANKAFIVSLDMTSGSFFTGRILFTDVILHPYFRDIQLISNLLFVRVIDIL